MTDALPKDQQDSIRTGYQVAAQLLAYEGQRGLVCVQRDVGREFRRGAARASDNRAAG